MNQLEKAITMSAAGHTGQTDKAGQPYILHPLRIMLKMSTVEEQIVAVLHDVVEDTDLSIDDLRLAGFNDEICEALDRLTHRPGEDYMAYIDRISENRLASKVKLADLDDNLCVDRLPELSAQDLARTKKYERARRLLLDRVKSE